MLPALPSRNVLRGTLRPQVVVELPPLRAVRLLNQIRERCLLVHYSLQTEQAYVYWARTFKGGKDRVVMRPQSLPAALRAHLGACREVWQGDVRSPLDSLECAEPPQSGRW